MTQLTRVSLTTLLSCLVTHCGFSQGTDSVVNYRRPKPPVIVDSGSTTAKSARESLDAPVKLEAIKCKLRLLGDLLTERLKKPPVFVDLRAIEMAGHSKDKIIEESKALPEMPLRSALRHLLQPHGLRVVVEDEGLVITADFAELTRRGVATDRWVDKPSAAYEKIGSALDKSISLKFVDASLNAAIANISRSEQLPIVIDKRALEEIGIDPAEKNITLNLQNVSLRSLLRSMLRELDLTYHIKDEVLQITTIEAAEKNLTSRIYFLEGIGIPIGDYQSVVKLIQASVVPDTWEALGGPSTIIPISAWVPGRPAIVISTTSDVHEQVESLLAVMRETQVGPDARVERANAKKSTAAMSGVGKFHFGFGS